MSMERLARKKKAAIEARAKAEAEIRILEEQGKMHIGELAAKAGLLDVEFSDAEMIAALKEVAARFRGKEKPPAKKAG
jgi:hypothetical protein